MTTAPRLNDKRHEELPKDLSELVALIAKLPTEHRREIDPVVLRVVESTKRRRRILNLVQDAISQLRLDMKYLVFDLEATRRERDAYRHELEGTESDDGTDLSDGPNFDDSSNDHS
jgi:hypothetical protein